MKRPAGFHWVRLDDPRFCLVHVLTDSAPSTGLLPFGMHDFRCRSDRVTSS